MVASRHVSNNCSNVGKSIEAVKDRVLKATASMSSFQDMTPVTGLFETIMNIFQLYMYLVL
jgi:hypothetical protein